MLDGWPDEATRPRVTSPNEPQAGHANQTLLSQVHQHLRSEVATIADALAGIAAGGGPVDDQSAVGDVRAMIQRMFPDLAATEPALAPVLERLRAEHEVISELLVRLDDTVVALVADLTNAAATRAAAGRLAEVLGSHLAYEEEQLLGPLGRLPVGI